MFAVAMPLQMRATNSQIKVGAKPSIAIPIAEAAMLQSSTGRRPTRSESRPQIGMKRNCMMEKTAPGMRGHEVAGAEAPRDAGQKRDHQPEAEQVEEDR